MTVCMLLEAPQATTGALDPYGPPSIILFSPPPPHKVTMHHNRPYDPRLCQWSAHLWLGLAHGPSPNKNGTQLCLLTYTNIAGRTAESVFTGAFG